MYVEGTHYTVFGKSIDSCLTAVAYKKENKCNGHDLKELNRIFKARVLSKPLRK